MDGYSTIDSFLLSLFEGEVGPHSQLAIFTLKDKRTCFHFDIEEAAQYAASKAAETDVYFGCGLLEPPASGRGSAGDVHVITSVWADVDIADAVHQKANRPPNVDEARRLIAAIGPEPSMVIHSGHGIQAWWLFDKPWIFADDAERNLAAGFLKRWQRTVTLAAKKYGYVVDSVSDLARVMRLPGTINHKDKEKPLPVTVLLDNQIRYDRIRDIDPLLVADEYAAESSVVQIGLIKLNPAAVAPPQVDVLAGNDDKFRDTWNHDRKDLADQSPSSYDMALVNTMVMAGFDDQAIADTIIHFRREHKLDIQKGLRRDYIQRTIGRARTDYLKNQAIDDMAHSIPDGGRPDDTGDPVYKEKRERCLKNIGNLFGVSVKAITQYGREDARYRMTLADGRDFPIGTINVLTTQRLFIQRMIQETGKEPALKPKQWQALKQAMIFVMDVIDDPSTRTKSRMIEWLTSYRGGAGEVKELTGQDEPFIFEGSFYLRWENFKQYLLFVKFNKDVTDPEIKENLGVLGFVRKNVNIKFSDHWTTKSYYIIDVKQLDIVLNSLSEKQEELKTEN